MPPSLRQLEVFRLLMRTRSVTETARLMRVSQPAISQSLRELERELGLDLFIRRGGRIHPTAEGMGLLREVDRVFVQLSALESRAAELGDARAGSLTVASIPTLLGSLVPRAAARLLAERPRLRLRLTAEDTQAVARQVREESVDLGLVYSPVEEPGIAAEPLFGTAIVCLMPAGHPLAARRVVTPALLEQERVLMLTPGTPPGLLLREALERHRIALGRALETNTSFAAVSLVREGVGVALTDPAILLSAAARGLLARPFEPRIEMRLALLFSRQRPVPRVATRFVALLREVLDEMAQDLGALGLPAERL
jgi:DNA-binding transcriptional LysR family regulator